MTTFRPHLWEPLFDTMILHLCGPEEEDPDAIVLPETLKDKTVTAMVEAAGPGALQEDGTFRPLMVKRGDTVIFNEDAECLDLGNGYYLAREHHVWARRRTTESKA